MKRSKGAIPWHHVVLLPYCAWLAPSVLYMIGKRYAGPREHARWRPLAAQWIQLRGTKAELHRSVLLLLLLLLILLFVLLLLLLSSSSSLMLHMSIIWKCVMSHDRLSVLRGKNFNVGRFCHSVARTLPLTFFKGHRSARKQTLLRKVLSHKVFNRF